MPHKYICFACLPIWWTLQCMVLKNISVFEDLNMHVGKICSHGYMETNRVLFFNLHYRDFPQETKCCTSFFQTAVRTHHKTTTYHNWIVLSHDDVIKWKHFPRYWPFVRGIHRSPVKTPQKRPVARSFDVFFDLRSNKRLSKHWWCWWFETQSRLLWCHCKDIVAVCEPFTYKD